MKFIAYGHKNILATHKTTIEITKDKDLTKRGNCIIGVNSDFEFKELKKLASGKNKKIMIRIEIKGINDEIIAETNNSFDHSCEFVVRKSDFKDRRTLAVKSNKGAIDLKRELISKLNDKSKGKDTVMNIRIETI